MCSQEKELVCEYMCNFNSQAQRYRSSETSLSAMVEIVI